MIVPNKNVIFIFLFFVIINLFFVDSATYLDVPQNEIDCIDKFVTKFNLVNHFPKTGGYYKTLCAVSSSTLCYSNGSISQFFGTGAKDSVPTGVKVEISDLTCLPFMNNLILDSLIINSNVVYYRYDYVKSISTTNIYVSLNQSFPPLDYYYVSYGGYEPVQTIKMSIFNQVKSIQIKFFKYSIFEVDQDAVGTTLVGMDVNTLNLPNFDRYNWNSITMNFGINLNSDDLLKNFTFINAISPRFQFSGQVPFYLHLNKKLLTMIHSGVLLPPSQIYDLRGTNSNYQQLSISSVGPNFIYNNQIPLIVSNTTNLDITMHGTNTTYISPVPDLNYNGPNKVQIYNSLFISGDLPKFYGKGAGYGYQNNKITGTIDKSWCGTNLIVTNNLLSGTVPSCFSCYFSVTTTFQISLGDPLSTIFQPAMYDRFTGNAFTNFTKTIACTTYMPQVKYFNTTTFILTGVDIGLNLENYYINSTSITCGTTTKESVIRLGYEYYCNTKLYYSAFTPDSVFTLYNTGTKKNYMMAFNTKKPVFTSITTTNNNQISIVGNFFSSYIGQSVQNVTIDIDINCVITVGSFSSITCTAPVVLSDTKKLLVLKNGNQYKKVYAVFQNGFVNKEQCPNDCVGNSNGGICNMATGSCEDCPNDCGGPTHGTCLPSGDCQCINGYGDDDCSGIQCKDPFCAGGGVCNYTNGTCKCDSNHQGSDCSIPYIQCPINNGLFCSGSGTCNNQTGICSCNTNYQGDDCSKPNIQCPMDSNSNICFGHGSCNSQTGVCTCSSNYQGKDCSKPFIQCPMDSNSNICFGHGSCNNQTGVCSCTSNYQGDDCSKPYIACPVINSNICSGSGSCNNQTGVCTCNPDHQGKDCSTPFIQCPVINSQLCSGFGSCNNQTGICTCDNSHQSSDCSKPYIACPVINSNICSGFGSCNNQTGVCTCNPGWQSSDCSKPFIQCQMDSNSNICFGHGSCNNQTGVCSCTSNYQGDDCSKPYIACPVINSNICAGSGSCNNQTGVCTCNPDHQGKDCSTPFVQCPVINSELCSGFGSCNNQTGVCTCNQDHQGKDCSTPFIQCPAINSQICSGFGSCNNQTGECTCEPDWQSSDCSKPYVQCPVSNSELCSGFGSCNNQTGVCTCDPDWQSLDCSIPFIQCQEPNCLNQGLCNNITGICNCNEGYSGDYCQYFYHYVTSVSPSNEKGGQVSFYGNFGTTHSELSILIDSIHCNVSSVSETIISCDIEPGYGIHSVNITQNNFSFIGKNIYEYIKLDSDTIDCPNNCSNNGKCNQNGQCNCNDGFKSFDCSSKDSSSLNISIGKTGLVLIENEGLSFNVFLLSLNEVNLNNEIIKSYQLNQNWLLNTSISNIYQYSQSPNNDFEITLAIEQIDNSSIQLSTSIKNYHYQSVLNIIQIELISNINNLDKSAITCNKQDIELETNYLNNQYQVNYMKLSKNNKNIIGSFNNQVGSDSRMTFLPTNFKNDSNSISLFLNLPHCVEECVIDSLVFNAYLDSKYSYCGSSTENEEKDNNNKWKIPVGVCVGVAGAVCLGLAFYKIKTIKKGKSSSVNLKNLKQRNF